MSTPTHRNGESWIVYLAAWLVLVPASLVLVRGLLPSDGLGPEEPSGSIGHGAFVAAPPEPVLGIGRDDLILRIDGHTIDELLRTPRSRPVAAGDVHRYLVTEPGGSGRREVAVTIRARRDLTGFAAARLSMLVVFSCTLAAGAWLRRRRPDEPAAAALLLLGSCLLSIALASMGSIEPLDLFARPWLLAWSTLALPGFLTLPFAALWFALTFPSPRPGAPHRLVKALVVGPAVATFVVGIWQLIGGSSTSSVLAVDDAAGFVFAIGMLSAIVTVVVRWTRARRDPVQRRRIQLVGLGFALSFVPIVLFATVASEAPGVVFPLLVLPFVASIGMAISRNELFDLEVAINRTLVATAAGGVLLALYLGAVAATAVVTGGSGPLVALPAAGLVAVSFAPVRDSVRRHVDRRLHGLSSDPRLLFHRLGVRLEAAGDPYTLAAAVVETVVDGLRVAYAAVEVATDDGWQTLDERGRRTDPVDLIDVEVGGETVGRLVVAPRRDGSSLSPADRGLLEDLARHSGVALRVGALLAEVRAAQQRLLVATEEERHRIQRDLHDGIGPVLVGLALQLSVAADAVADPELGALLGRLNEEATRATDDVRRLVRNLVPRELDSVGLVMALITAASRLRSESGLDVRVVATTTLPDCSTEVEDAAYKMCLEAMTNAVRHSGGSACMVKLGTAVTGELALEVRDDGRGIGEAPDGTGLTSMRTRSAALGGEFSVRSSPSGTCIEINLPRALAS